MATPVATPDATPATRPSSNTGVSGTKPVIAATKPAITATKPGNATAKPSVAWARVAPGADSGSGKPAVVPTKAAPHEPRLAILVYHDVDDRLSNAFTISTAQLDAQVKMLVDEGYAFYHLSDVERLLAGGTGMPERAVLLAFDDGYSSFYTHVMPTARKYGVPVTCFVVTRYLKQIVTGSLPHMSASQVRELAASPLSDLAGHGHDGHYQAATADGSSKPVLTQPIRKANGQVETEVEYQDRVRGDFKQTIAALSDHGVGRSVRHFTFPFTASSAEAVRLGQQAGVEYFYVGGEQLVTPHSDRTAIPRVHAGGPDITADVLRVKLRKLFAQP